MAEPVMTAGRLQPPAPLDPRKAAVRTIREVLRKADTSDDEFEGALEALIELSKD